MAARVQVIVETKDVSSGILRGITAQFGQLGSVVEELTGKNVNWGNLAVSATQLVVDGLKDAVKVTQQYAGEVRDLALISGQGAEEASRLLQVLDDFEISATDVNAAVKAMTKEGLTPNVETIAQLSDQYLQLNDAQAKNEFILKNLGRSGLQWVNVLNQGSSAILALNAGVNSSLILTDENIRKTEEYRLAVDSMGDSWQAIKVEVGMEAIPILSGAMDQLNGNIQESGALLGLLKFGWDDIFRIFSDGDEVIDSATASYIAMGEALASTTNPALEITKENYKDIISSARTLGEVTDENVKKAAFNMLQLKLAADGVISEEDAAVLEQSGVALGVMDQKSIDATKSMDKLTDQVAAGTLEVQEFIKAINNIPREVIVTTVNVNSMSPDPLTLAGGNQVGGKVYAGQPTMVGEAGAEPFIPQQNGRILGHAESLHALSMQGGGGTNYFYGNVTLQIGEGDASGLMSMR